MTAVNIRLRNSRSLSSFILRVKKKIELVLKQFSLNTNLFFKITRVSLLTIYCRQNVFLIRSMPHFYYKTPEVYLKLN
jgi:hypothetical protein